MSDAPPSSTQTPAQLVVMNANTSSLHRLTWLASSCLLEKQDCLRWSPICGQNTCTLHGVRVQCMYQVA
jgi:hypothetical protein